jgi:hypothetical protein
MRRILFLDVDGVLNHEGMPEPDGEPPLYGAPLCRDCIRRLSDVCDQTGARIVVSSSWRLNPDSMRDLRAALGGRIIGATPARNVGARHKEIEEWIVQAREPIDGVVVDDDTDAEVALMPFVRTDFLNGGFTDAHAAQIRARWAA